jgi:hypothetical protein
VTAPREDGAQAHRLRLLLAISSGLAAISLIPPWGLWAAGQFDLAANAFTLGCWCAFASVGLLVAGLFAVGRRGLWLMVPAAVALALPLYVGMSLGNAIAACEQRHDHPICVP